MLWLVVSVAVLGGALLVLLVRVATLRLATHAEHDDQPGVHSAATFQLRKDPEALASLLDRVHAALERAGADASTFQASSARESGEAFELDGMLGVDSFRVTLARITLDDELPSSHEGYLLLLHARTLGRYRYVAPPDNETTRTLLAALDRGVRSPNDVLGVTWQRRQDAGATLSEAS